MPQPRGAANALPTMPPALAGWAARLQLSGLDDGTAETARQYLSRYYTLTPAARTDFGQRIAAAVAAQVSPAPPPGATPPDYLSAVLAERRAREQARMMGRVTLGDSGRQRPRRPARSCQGPGCRPPARRPSPARTSPARPARAGRPRVPRTAQEGSFRPDDQMTSPAR